MGDFSWIWFDIFCFPNFDDDSDAGFVNIVIE